MKQIKFSHWYKKFDWVLDDLNKQNNSARLIQIFKCHYKDLSKEFIDYDTIYPCSFYDDAPTNKYELPQTELMVLMFVSMSSGNLFTTIRRFTPEKYRYYRSSVGELFGVVIE